MKKLVIFMLVLGMASAANAVLYLNANVDNTGVTVDGIADADMYLIVVSDGTLSPLNATALGTMPPVPDASKYSGPASDMAEVMYIPEGMTGGDWFVGSWSLFPPYSEGKYLTLSCAYTGSATVWAAYFDELLNEGAGGSVFIGEVLLPEPATIALLGLGGLLLCRRKK